MTINVYISRQRSFHGTGIENSRDKRRKQRQPAVKGKLELSLNKWRTPNGNALMELLTLFSLSLSSSSLPPSPCPSPCLRSFVSILTVYVTASCVGSTKDLTNTPIKYKRTREREREREDNYGKGRKGGHKVSLFLLHLHLTLMPDENGTAVTPATLPVLTALEFILSHTDNVTFCPNDNKSAQ